jgi:methyl-accepting chemotaxis protein
MAVTMGIAADESDAQTAHDTAQTAHDTTQNAHDTAQTAHDTAQTVHDTCPNCRPRHCGSHPPSRA